MSDPTPDIPRIGRPTIPGLDTPRTLSGGFSRPRLDLGDYTLKLDPQLTADLAALRIGRITPHLRRRWINPDWSLLDRSALIGRLSNAHGVCAWSAPGAGPSTPKKVPSAMR